MFSTTLPGSIDGNRIRGSSNSGVGGHLKEGRKYFTSCGNDEIDTLFHPSHRLISMYITGDITAASADV